MDNQNESTPRPIDRLDDASVDIVVASIPFLRRRLLLAGHLGRGGRALLWVWRVFTGSLKWIIGWLPKLLKALLVVPSVLALLEGLGLPVLTIPREWIEAIVTAKELQ